MNQCPEVANSLLYQLLFKGTFCQAPRAINAAQCRHFCPAPSSSCSSACFQLLSSLLLLSAGKGSDIQRTHGYTWAGVGRCHKALPPEFCLEKENCFFRPKADDCMLNLQGKVLPNLQLFVATVCRYSLLIFLQSLFLLC